MNIADQWDILTRARRSVPVDVHQLTAALGVRLKTAFLAPNISGMLERVGEKFLITLNTGDSYTRQRFTLAHELGHYMLHRHLVGDGLDDDRAYRSTNVGKYHNTMIGPKEETEANKFAASLLMPSESVNREWAKPGSTPAQMASLFGVSEHAMSIRLGVPYEPA
ncbi:ImmA/IrrE family metallo-endopeptidase [Boseongicola sp. H5]|uniref:ImmA/IrrE family metallo-endopeptidase n=1 Tax=Boseongicola sp. H5 TaxID=2763261 RepID=UPI001D09BA94|nr:ImmA/IrrE family metallo-endopeptidase [Boseongicola sp. H5]